MYWVFVGISVLRYRKYQGCDICNIICDTCNLYLSVRIMSVFIRVLLYRTYLCTCIFYVYSLCFCQNTLYCDTRSFWCSPIPIPRSSFAMGEGVRPKDQNIYAQPHHMYKCNGGGCVNTFLL
jgi:hypothetical protein